MVRVHLPIWFEPESFGCRDTGSSILINPETNDTIALGIIEVIEPAPSGGTKASLLHLIRSAETHARSIAKTVSWRATGSLDIFVLPALITGNARLASAVARAKILTKTALYYVHERAWALVPWGRRRIYVSASCIAGFLAGATGLQGTRDRIEI